MAAFLTLNGWDVPVAIDNASIGQVEVGSRDRSNDGSLGISRTALKDGLDFGTSWMSPVDGVGLRGLLLGRGDHWSFDPDANGLYTYSGKGRAKDSGTVATFGSFTLVDGGGTRQIPKFGTGCIEVSPAVTNLLPSNVATGTDTSGNTTGFGNNAGATIASSAATAWQGSRSLSVLTAATTQGSGAQAVVAASPSTPYSGSIYLKAASGTPTVRVYLKETAGGAAIGTAVNITLSSTKWTRAQCALTTGGAVAQIAIVVDTPTNLQAAFTFYADGWQVEQNAGYWTAWVDGTRTAGSLAYALTDMRAGDDVTIAGWFRASGSVVSGKLFAIGTTTDKLVVYDGGGFISIDVYVAGTLVGTYTGTPVATFSGDFLHVAMVMQRQPPTGAHSLTVYVNGALDDSLSFGSLPGWGASPLLYLGTDVGGSSPGHYTIDDTVAFPFALSAAQIAGIYNLGSAHPDVPFLKISGTLAGAPTGSELTMAASDTKVTTATAAISGTTYTDARKVSAHLEEV